jgi:hypothetical protein
MKKTKTKTKTNKQTQASIYHGENLPLGFFHSHHYCQQESEALKALLPPPFSLYSCKHPTNTQPLTLLKLQPLSAFFILHAESQVFSFSF